MPAMVEQYNVVDDTDGISCLSEVDGAVSKEWDGSVASSFAGGSGTKSAPYLIATGEQLALLAKNVDNGTTYDGKYFKLTADILLNDDVNTDPNTWNSFGDQDSECSINGTFDGDNYDIIGLYQNVSGSNGLFAYNKGTIQSVSLIDGSIVIGESDVGAVCGENRGTLSNCYNAVKISDSTAYSNLGGVCRYNDHGTIIDCRNNG